MMSNEEFVYSIYHFLILVFSSKIKVCILVEQKQ